MTPPVPHNLLSPLPAASGVETCATLLRHESFTLEHLVSCGASSPDDFWYDQERAEWVLLLCGQAELRFESGDTQQLTAGDALIIPARCRHRVEHTSPDARWLALHYQEM